MSKLSNQSWRSFTKFLEYIGCTHVRTQGDHMMFHKEGLLRPLVVPKWDTLPEFIVKNNLRILKISTRQFTELCEEMRKQRFH